MIERFPPEPPSETVIWRYMDDWKFEQMLQPYSDGHLWGRTNVPKHDSPPGQLWFTHPWKLAGGDGGEGTFPKANMNKETYCDRMAELLGLSDEEARARKRHFLDTDTRPLTDGVYCMAQLSGISCWRNDRVVAAEMWDFLAGNNGVAVKSTVGQVKDALMLPGNSLSKLSRTRSVEANYIDHRNDFLPVDGYWWLLSSVGQSWSNEQEIRFIGKGPQFCSIPMNVTIKGIHAKLSEEEKLRSLERITKQASTALDDILTRQIKGFFLPIDLSHLFGEVVVAPTSDPSYADDVRSLLKAASCGDVAVNPC